MEPLYKIVGPNGECLNGGSGDWPLPIGDAPGEWRTIDGPLEACHNGLHLATAEQVPMWYRPAYGDRGVVYRVETDGPLIDAGTKWVAGKVRLLPRRMPAGAPDMVKEAATLERRKRAAIRKYDAVRATATVPAVWHRYLRDIGSQRLPAGHPGAVYQAAYRADDARLQAAENARATAIGKAQRAYDAAAIAHVLPE